MAALILAGAAMFSISLVSCGDKKDKGEISFSSYSFSEVADGADSDSLRNVLENFDGRWSVKLTGVLPEKIGEKSVDALRDSLYNLADLSIDEKGNLVVKYPSELKALEKEIADTISSGRKPGSAYENNLSVAMLTPKVVVFRNFKYSYPEGAAHPVWLNNYLNYDIKSGQIITMRSLFTDGYGKLLRPAIENKLQEAGVDLFPDQEISLPKQFRLTPTGIDFIYNIYEIAPYAAGEPTVHFTYYELESIMSPAGKALLLGDKE